MTAGGAMAPLLNHTAMVNDCIVCLDLSLRPGQDNDKSSNPRWWRPKVHRASSPWQNLESELSSVYTLHSIFPLDARHLDLLQLQNERSPLR